MPSLSKGYCGGGGVEVGTGAGVLVAAGGGAEVGGTGVGVGGGVGGTAVGGTAVGGTGVGVRGTGVADAAAVGGMGLGVGSWRVGVAVGRAVGWAVLCSRPGDKTLAVISPAAAVCSSNMVGSGSGWPVRLGWGVVAAVTGGCEDGRVG
jgi:hypothetical protein